MTEGSITVEVLARSSDSESDDTGNPQVKDNGHVRARTVSIKRLSKRAIEHGKLLYPAMPGVDYDRPKTRADCEDGCRPCPFVSCKYHLALDVNPKTGSIKLNFPDLEVEDMPETCVLDIADKGGLTLEETGDVLNLTRERIRQVEIVAIAKLKALGAMNAMEDFADDTDSHTERLNQGLVKCWGDVR
jgi:hypothetical protein